MIIYLFANSDGKGVIKIREQYSSDEIDTHIAKYRWSDRIFDDDEGDYITRAIFLSFHH